MKQPNHIVVISKGEYANLTTLECLRFYRKDFDILKYEQCLPILQEPPQVQCVHFAFVDHSHSQCTKRCGIGYETFH